MKAEQQVSPNGRASPLKGGCAGSIPVTYYKFGWVIAAGGPPTYFILTETRKDDYMLYLTSFVEYYETMVGLVMALLEKREEVLQEGAQIEFLESIVPYKDEEYVNVRARVKLDMHQTTENSVGCSSYWADFQIPFFAFEDSDRWLNEVKEMSDQLKNMNPQDVVKWADEIPVD